MNFRTSSYGLLWSVSKGSRALYLVSILFMFCATLCSFLLPQVVRFVVDCVVGGKTEDLPIISAIFRALGEGWSPQALAGRLEAVGLAVVVIAAAGGVSTFIYRKAVAVGAERMIKRLRDKLFSHIQYLPYSWHVAASTGDIVQRCTSDVDVVQSFVSLQLTEIVRAAALVILAYAILIPINLTMALTSMIFLPIITVFSVVFLRSVSGRFLAADEAEGELLSIAQENFTGVRVVRAFGRERYEVDRFDAQNAAYTSLWLRLGDMISVYWGMGELLTGLQMVTLCAAGVYQAAAGRLTVGEFIVFLTYNAMVIWPIRGLARVLSEASKAGVSLKRLREILDEPGESESEKALRPSGFGDIVFDRVCFSHGQNPVLRGISFTVKAGTTLGIIGATGSGKTTIAHLLCRLYDLTPGCGEIRIGGTNIRDIDRFWLRSRIGIALQEPFLYSRTIRENIAALSDRYDMSEIYDASVIARIDAEIRGFPFGYETVVGERGVTLSGGQKQRVAIARAIMGNPPILIFDDSLSAVDTETDVFIRRALRKRSRGVTTIIISHRVTTVAGAEQIIVLDRGRIAEQGSPEELLTRGGLYRRIWDMQQSMEDELA